MSWKWRVSESLLSDLHAKAGNVVAKLDLHACGSEGWDKAWNLVLPEANKEIESWF